MSATEYDADGFNRPPTVYDANNRRGKLSKNMEGLLWRVRADLTVEYEYKTEKGTRKDGERSIALGGDEAEAISQWKVLSGKAEQGEIVIPSGKHRFADAWAIYLAKSERRIAQGKLARKSLTNYENVYEHHFREAWGDIFLRGIEPDDIVDYFADKNERFSQAYQKQMQVVMKHCLAVACEKKWLTVNPLLLVDKMDLPIQQNEATYQARLFRNEELASMFLACNKLYTRQLVVMAFTGMRIGELCGLKWRNVNLAERVIYVRGQLLIEPGRINTETGYSQGPPKGRRTATELQSIRDIDMLDGAYHALVTQQENETEKGLGGPDDWVFTGSTSSGLPINPHNFRGRGVQRAALDAGLGHVRPHDFRHTAASLLAAAGVTDVVAAQMMGHTTAMYQKRYAKAFRDAIERRESRNKLAGIGFGGRVAI